MLLYKVNSCSLTFVSSGSESWNLQSLLPTWGTEGPPGQTFRHTDRHKNIPQWIPKGQTRPESKVCADLFIFSFASSVSPPPPCPSYFKHKVNHSLMPKTNQNGIRPGSTMKWRMISVPVKLNCSIMRHSSLPGSKVTSSCKKSFYARETWEQSPGTKKILVYTVSVCPILTPRMPLNVQCHCVYTSGVVWAWECY